MTIIFKIAKNELRHLFYSPVAWLLLVLFFIQCGYFYSTAVYSFALQQEVIIKNSPYFNGWPFSLTRAIFLNPDSIFLKAMNNLYLFIPLLTMSMFSREFVAGTYKLLFSSRVTAAELVLGKFLGIVFFDLFFILITGLCIGFGAISIQHASLSLLLSALLGCGLTIFAFSAIGMYMSTLSNYQLVGAIGTFAALFLIGRLQYVWQGFDILRDVTWSLSSTGRLYKMVTGLIRSADIIYFLAIIFMFAGFTWVRMRSIAYPQSWVITARYYVIVTFSGVSMIFVASLPRLTFYRDVSPAQQNTVHPRTQALLAAFDPAAPLEVTLYANLLDGASVNVGLPHGRNIYLSELWEPYLRFYPNMRFKYVYYYDADTSSTQGKLLFEMYPGKSLRDIAKMTAGQYNVNFSAFLSPQQIRRYFDPSTESGSLVMQLSYKDQKQFLRTFAGVWPTEIHVAAALKKLLYPPAPLITYLTGDLERSPFGYTERDLSSSASSKFDRISLINLGFDIDTLTAGSRPIPAKTRLLVLADPKKRLPEAGLHAIRSYVEAGGNMLIMAEPGKQDLVNEVLASSNINMRLLPGSVVEPSRNETPDKVYAYLTPDGLNLAEDGAFQLVKRAIARRETHPRLRTFGQDTFGLTLTGTSAIAFSDTGRFTCHPLLLPRPTGNWVKTVPLVADSATPIMDVAAGDLPGAFPVCMLATRKSAAHLQKIILSGDADFMSNLRLISGLPVALALYSSLADNEYPIYTPREPAKDIRMDLSDRQAYLQQLLFTWMIPGLLLVAGAIILIRRKRK